MKYKNPQKGSIVNKVENMMQNDERKANIVPTPQAIQIKSEENVIKLVKIQSSK